MQVKHLVALLWLVIVEAPFLHAQLQFNPNVDQGVAFERVIVGNSLQFELVLTSVPPGGGAQTVLINIAGAGFARNPNMFQFNNAGEQGRLVLTFTPQQVGFVEGTLTLICFPRNGRQFQYDISLRGTGIDQPVPEIEVSPDSVSLTVEQLDGSDEAVLNIINHSEAVLEWSIPDFDADWLTVQPREGRNQGMRQEVVLRTDNLPEENGDYEVVLFVQSNAPDNQEIEVPVVLHLNIQAPHSQVLHLRHGWNLISLNVIPDERYFVNGMLTPEGLTSEIDDNLIIIKDFRGGFCLPNSGYWGIDEWSLADGYQVKTTAELDWEVFGEPIPADLPLEVSAGWSMIAYYPTESFRFIDAFRDLHHQGVIVILKDGFGNFFLPDDRLRFGWDYMAAPGMGFHVKLSEPATFHYPAE